MNQPVATDENYPYDVQLHNAIKIYERGSNMIFISGTAKWIDAPTGKFMAKIIAISQDTGTPEHFIFVGLGRGFRIFTMSEWDIMTGPNGRALLGDHYNNDHAA